MLSLLALPGTAALTTLWMKPAPDDDFGMGPLLGGLLLGSLAVFPLSLAALWLGGRLRRQRPLAHPALVGLELFVLVAPISAVIVVGCVLVVQLLWIPGFAVLLPAVVAYLSGQSAGRRRELSSPANAERAGDAAGPS